MNWPFGSKKRAELTPQELTQLARVCLDVQFRTIDAIGTMGVSAKQNTQLRHELFKTWLITYHVTSLPNGMEHHLAVSNDGEIPPEFREPIMKDALRILAFCVRVSRLMTTAPFDVEPTGISVRRILLPDQSKKLKRAAEHVPTPEALAALWSAATNEATALESKLVVPFASSPSSLRPANQG